MIVDVDVVVLWSVEMVYLVVIYGVYAVATIDGEILCQSCLRQEGEEAGPVVVRNVQDIHVWDDSCIQSRAFYSRDLV